jgi:hypothetical protein
MSTQPGEDQEGEAKGRRRKNRQRGVRRGACAAVTKIFYPKIYKI